MSPIAYRSTCSASTTASNSGRPDKLPFFKGDVICDWLSFVHTYSPLDNIQPLVAGKTVKIDIEGNIEYEIADAINHSCASSSTSVRIRCDGRTLKFTGNIGRFGQNDNVTGLNVQDCIQKAVELIKEHYPKLYVNTLGSTQFHPALGFIGTKLTRLDLASNFLTDSYSQIAQLFASRKLNSKLPVIGKYGPTWGYDTKRGQYWKAKLYDKRAEQEKKRTPYTNETLARFEIQLGSEYLRQKNLNLCQKWNAQMKTENIIYGHFSSQLTRETATAESWTDIPAKLRQHAIMYRDGIDPKSYLKKSQYYAVRSQLINYGLDISRPCNVLNLTQRIKTVSFVSQPSLRRVA